MVGVCQWTLNTFFKMVKIYKKTEVVQFGEMIQEFKVVSPVKVLELKYKVVNGKVKCL